ncbi:MAG: hypothetical protein M3436_17410 [Pseudomonadota bacterium]|nr:hypothetical protein [Pseudomonadota bacterium]
MAVVCSLLGVIFAVTTNQARLARRIIDRGAAIAYADAVLEHLFDEWRIAMISLPDSKERDAGLTTQALTANLSAPTSIEMPVPAGLMLQDWAVVAADPMLAPMADLTTSPKPENGTHSVLRTRVYYLARATVSYPGAAPINTVTVQRTFVRSGRNVFEDFVFSALPITEIASTQPMYIDGSVYFGGDLYTPHDDLHFVRDVTFSGMHQLDYRPNDSRYNPAVNGNIDNDGLDDNWDSNNPPRRGEQRKLIDTVNGDFEQVFLTDDTSLHVDADGNPDNDGFHEMIEEVVNPVGDPLRIDPTTSDRFSNNADYRIEVTTSGDPVAGFTTALDIYKGAYTLLTSGTPEYQAIQAALRLDTVLKDQRESGYVRAVAMDVDIIRANYATATITDSVNIGDGLLIHFKDNSGPNIGGNIYDRTGLTPPVPVSSINARGLKLTNGARLPSDGFTVVTQHTIYIEGDYNTGSPTGAATPSNNDALPYIPPLDKPDPVAPGYTRVPAAVIADAVNVLSNAWNDKYSTYLIDSRTASSSTINTVVVSGNVPTTMAGGYSGGVENCLRLHENWNGKYFTIYGALGMLFPSRDFKGPWAAAIYVGPNRRWYYDDLLRDRNPPGFPMARVYERGLWTLR